MTNQTEHTPVAKPPTYDTILRTRLAALIKLHAPSKAGAASSAGWAESTLYRRLNLDPNDSNNYRPLAAGDVDELLAGIKLTPDALLQPALLDGDSELLQWVDKRTPADPLPSRAMWMRHCMDDGTDRLIRLVLQGLLVVCGDPDNQHTWYIRLTPTGQRALR